MNTCIPKIIAQIMKLESDVTAQQNNQKHINPIYMIGKFPIRKQPQIFSLNLILRHLVERRPDAGFYPNLFLFFIREISNY